MDQFEKLEVDIQSIGGNCPVQAEGVIDGKPFYFRARGNRWSLTIGQPIHGDGEWYYEEPYGEEEYAAGWMTEDETRAFIWKGVGLYHSARQNA